MYKWSRSAIVAQGKNEEAAKFAEDISEYVSEHYIPVLFGIELAGRFGRIHWFAEPESAAHWEEINLGLLADERYQKLLNDAGELFVAGETRDTLVMLLPAD